MRAIKILVLFCLTSIIMGCSVQKNKEIAVTEVTKAPVNVILLIGDGMGLSQISILHQEQDNLSAFSRFNHMGLINCSSSSHKITDSAAGATAFASGVKSYNGAIGVNRDSLPVKTILEVLEERQYATGLVSTSSITHATPAAFYAHTKSRNNENDIAIQLMASKVDYFAGGGKSFFRTLINRSAESNWIIDTMNYFQFPLEMNQEHRYGFLLSDEGLPKMSEGRGSFCTDASRIAIDFLGKNHEGFFLMIEGSQIDWGGHAKDYGYVQAEMLDFNEVVNMVMDYAEKQKNTLVIVTSDHETGGLALTVTQKKDSTGKVYNDYDDITAAFSTGTHTAALIPVFAFGPGAENFTGIYQNAEIYSRILKSVR